MKLYPAIIVLILLTIFPCLTQAKNYEISVTRKAGNVYKVDGEDFIIQTRYCYEYAYSETSFLKMFGYGGEIIFTDSGSKCDVKAVYSKVEQKPGKYAVTVSHDADDWYEISGQDLFVKTDGCLSLGLGVEVVLSISKSGYGTMFIDQNKCMVEGIYGRVEL